MACEIFALNQHSLVRRLRQDAEKKKEPRHIAAQGAAK